ncbi:MAG: hypothetical protein ABI718_14310 [Acidobacteriota bacterium]
MSGRRGEREVSAFTGAIETEEIVSKVLGVGDFAQALRAEMPAGALLKIAGYIVLDHGGTL